MFRSYIQKLSLTLILALILTLTWTTLTYADGPGNLDITFGGTGVVTMSIGNRTGGNSVAVQADKKIVVAGYNDNAGFNIGFLVARYSITGTLDSSFNNTGIVTTSVSDVNSRGNSVMIQSDGKLVVSGVSFDGTKNNIAVVRYNSDGDLDTTFNNTGIVTTVIGSGSSGLAGIIQPDNKIIIVGYGESTGGQSAIAMARYQDDGTLDTTFNGTGIVTTSIGNGFDAGNTVALQPDGKIIIAGYTFNINNYFDFAVLRYQSDGSLDTTFGNSGIVTTSVGSKDDSGHSVVVLPNGKIVVAGSTRISDLDWNGAIVRYNSDGSLDTTFHGTGILTISEGEFYQALALTLTADNKMVIAGGSGISGSGVRFTVHRYLSSGELDTSFNNSGIITTPITSGDDGGASIAIQADSKIVVAGFGDDLGDPILVVARYLGDPILNLAKSVADPTPAPGQAISYTVTLSNSGSTTATGLILTDMMDSNTTFSSASDGGLYQSNTVSWSVASLAPNESITRSIRVTVGTVAYGTLLTNTAWLTSAQTSTVTASITASVVTTNTSVVTPGAAITLTLAGGITITIPANTFTDTVILTFFPHPITNTGVFSHVGLFYTISGVYQDSGLAAQPQAGQRYTITVTYQQSDVPPGLDESTLALYAWNDSQWLKEASSLVDTQANTITATPDHFSLWAVLESTISERTLLPIILKQ